MSNADEKTGDNGMRLRDNEWTDANFIAGALCLDFSNTLSGRRQGRIKDRLTDTAALFEWFSAADLLPPAKKARAVKEIESQSRTATKTLADARTLRECIFDIFEAVRCEKPPDPAALITLNRFITETAAVREIECTNDGFEWGWRKTTDTAQQAIGRIALSAAELLTSERRFLVKKCIAENCAWLFIDETKNRSRIWCDMAVCGNRAKARRQRRSRR